MDNLKNAKLNKVISVKTEDSVIHALRRFGEFNFISEKFFFFFLMTMKTVMLPEEK